MLTKQQINSLPIGTYSNSVLRSMFKHHGTPVKFQDKDGKVTTLVVNRWWRRHRKKNPIKASNAKTHNIETEFRSRYGNNTKLKKSFWDGLFTGLKGLFKNLFA